MAINPFAEGSFKYAFEAFDSKLDKRMVMKLPKTRLTLEEMSKELEASNICIHIVNQFNERIIDFANDSDLLRDFARILIYQLKDQNTVEKLYFTEKYI